MNATRRRLRIGHIDIDQLTFDEALAEIAELIEARRGGYVFTPNVDHVVLAESDLRFRAAYAAADLSLVDGMPLVWASKVLGVPLAERISGSDLMIPLLEMAAARRWRVYFMGAGPGVAEEAARRVREQYGVEIVGTDSPRVVVGQQAEANDPLIQKIKATQPDLLFVALGAPKQELWIHEVAERLAPTVALGIGASLDFIAGTVPRAPRWMARSGLEWLYRLAREPRRLWRRYLVNDPKFAGVLVRDVVRARRRGQPASD